MWVKDAINVSAQLRKYGNTEFWLDLHVEHAVFVMPFSSTMRRDCLGRENV